jgi:glycosyltransferase involved in cell wall biosynthesis
MSGAGVLDRLGVEQTQAGGPTVSVVIPTLNEAESLPHTLGRLPWGLHEVIVVDGRSTDETIGVAVMYRPDAKVVMQPGRGKGDALRAGFEAATGDIIVMLDADGSTDPREIPAFVQALLDGADFAKGSRHLPGGGSDDFTRLRSVGNRVLRATVNALFGTRYTDLCYGYNAFWRACLPAIDLDCDGFEVETLLNIRVARAGLKVVEVPSYEHERFAGESKLNAASDGWRVLRTIVRERVARHPGVQPAAALESGELAGGALSA